jgi:hypothetical protein
MSTHIGATHIGTYGMNEVFMKNAIILNIIRVHNIFNLHDTEVVI